MVLKALNFNISTFVALAYNVMQLTEVGYFETINLNIKRMLNRSRNVDITTEPPLLAIRCYVPFFFTNLKIWQRL